MKLIGFIQFLLPLIWAMLYILVPVNIRSKKLAVIGSFLHLIVTLLTVAFLNLNSITTLFTINFSNFPLGNYEFGIDGISGVLVLLNSLLVFIAIIATYSAEVRKVRTYYSCIFILSWFVNSALYSLNLFSFYIFWELMLLPLFLLIGIFGDKDRRYASIKFFIYSGLGSIIMLLGIIYLSTESFKQVETLNLTIDVLKSISLPYNGFLSPQGLIFSAFCFAFFIKAPLFPFHSWLPSAHVQAPTIASVLLAGILLKIGTYGLIRFVIPVFPEAVSDFRSIILILCCISIIYGAVLAFYQDNIKGIIAYSSISHMGLIVAGIFSLGVQGIKGSIFFMFSHGLATAGLFIFAHCIYVRLHSKSLKDLGGIVKFFPVFGILSFIILLSSMATPLTSGFVSEFMILTSLYKTNKIVTIISGLGILLTPIYLLKLWHGTMLGEYNISKDHTLIKLNALELGALFLIATLILLLGLFPNILINLFNGSL